MNPMAEPNPAVAQQLAQAASAFEQRRTGHAPKSVSVVLSQDTLVITLRGALSPAETALARSPAAAAQMQELYRQLFASSADGLRQASARLETVPGAVMQMFPTGTVVQVFLLASSLPRAIWGGSGPGDQS
jgi:uncharacterized protein YbcI